MQLITQTKEHWFIFKNDQLLFIDTSAESKLSDTVLLDQLKSQFERQYALGPMHAVMCYCAEITAEAALPPGVQTLPLRQALIMVGEDWYGTAVKAFSVLHWDKNNQFCGHCGMPTIHKVGTFERDCTGCGLAHYPRISPSIIVLVKNNDKIIMSRSFHFPPGAYGLIAGFVEVGETIEEAVHREVKEEVGLAIKNLHYFGSQAWPFPDVLMLGFTADYLSGDITVDHRELESAGWYRYDNLPGHPSSSISIARKLIDHFIAQQTSSGSMTKF